MFELQPLYKTFFYAASALLGVQIVFFLNIITDPKEDWFLLAAMIALSASIPLLIGACVGAICGYMRVLKTLLVSGSLLSVCWFALALMSYSVIAGLVFLFVSLVSYKMLQNHYVDEKASEN